MNDRAAGPAQFIFKCRAATEIIHAASVAVSREHRRAKTDRLDTELLKRAFLGWLRGDELEPHTGKGAGGQERRLPLRVSRSALP